jgi:hypothetical protein
MLASLEMSLELQGVGSDNVTHAIAQLQKDGWIAAKRGDNQALDKPAMEARVCECNEVVKKNYEPLLPMCLRLRQCSSRTSP